LIGQAHSQNFTNTGTYTNNGTVRFNNFTNSNTGTVANTGNMQVRAALTNSAANTAFVTSNGAVSYIGKNTSQNIINNINNNTYGSLMLRMGGTKTLQGNITVPGKVFVRDSVTGTPVTKLALGSNTLQVSYVGVPFDTATGGNTPGTFDFTGGTVDYAGSGAQTVINQAYNNLTVSQAGGSKSLGGDVLVQGALTLAATNPDLSLGANRLTLAGSFSNAGTGTLTGGATSHMQVAGTSATAITLPAITLDTLTLARSNSGLTMGGSMTVGVLNLNSGTLAVGTNTLTLNGQPTQTTGTFTSSATGTVDYNKSSNSQTILAGSYGNLTFSGFSKTVAASTINIAGTFTPGGSTTAHTVTGNTIAFNGATGQQVPSFNTAGGGVGYNNLTILGNGSSKSASGDITFAGAFSNGSVTDSVYFDLGTHGLTGSSASNYNNSAVAFGGATGQAIAGTGYVLYNAAGAQTIAGGTYDKLQIEGTAGSQLKSILTGGSDVTANYTYVYGGQLVVGASRTLMVNNNIVNNSTVTNNGTIQVGAD